MAKKKLINTNKLSANFEPVEYKVTERSGSELVVENTTTGVTYPEKPVEQITLKHKAEQGKSERPTQIRKAPSRFGD